MSFDNSDPAETGSHQFAIISINCRFPGSNSPEEFWNIMQENSANRNFSGKSKETCRKHCEGLKQQVNFLKCPVDEFDAEFFHMNATKATFLDPQQRILLEMTWEALEKASINPHSLRGTSTGVFVGAWNIDYEKVLGQTLCAENREFHLGYISSSYGALSSHISYFLGLNGKHGTVDRGPASSLFTLHQACKNLERGECNLVIAAAVNLILFPRLGKPEPELLENGFAWKNIAEGCAVVVLKRLADAIVDRDHILGVIRSVGICTDAADGEFGEISGISIEKAIRNAHLIAKVDPTDISYVELHGRENLESDVINTIYGNDTNSEIIIDCVADVIGNAECVAGFASLIKILLCLKHETIPSRGPKSWQRCPIRKRIAAINSYGFASECAHLILEESPNFQNSIITENDRTSNCYNILTLSARSENALKKLLHEYKGFIETAESNISDICFTANCCRAQLCHRIAVHGNTKDEILNSINSNRFMIGKSSNQKPKIAFLFNDLSSFKLQILSKQFYENNSQFKNSLDKFSEIFQQNAICNVSLLDLLWRKGNAEEEREKYFLPINFCVQYSLTELLKSFGISPDIALGYNTGELSSACVAGILDTEETLKCLIKVSEEIHLYPKLILVSVAASKIVAEKLLSFYFEENLPVDTSELKIFAVNSIDQVIIACTSQNTAGKIVKLCLEETIEAKIMNSSKYNLDYTQIFPKISKSGKDSDSTCSYVSGYKENVFTLPTTQGNDPPKNFVDFSEAFKTLWLQGCRVFIDLGTNADLLRLAKLNISQTQSSGCAWSSILNSHEDNLCSLATLLSKLFVVGSNINWKQWNENNIRKKVPIPTYPFQKQKFWLM